RQKEAQAMVKLILRLPAPLLESVNQFALREHVTVDQFVAAALTEKVAMLAQMEYLEERAKRANKAKYFEILAKVPDVPPIPPDTEVPEHRRRKRKTAKRS